MSQDSTTEVIEEDAEQFEKHLITEEISGDSEEILNLYEITVEKEDSESTLKHLHQEYISPIIYGAGAGSLGVLIAFTIFYIYSSEGLFGLIAVGLLVAAVWYTIVEFLEEG